MLAPVPPKRGDGGSSFAALERYLCVKTDPDKKEQHERGETMISPALLSRETAVAEMRAVAEQNTRCKDPVLHLVLAWQAGEQPTREQWEWAVTHVMVSLKDRDGASMGEHQYMAVAHRDTRQFHIHIMANRVHPETYRANSPEWLHKTLDKACREIEAEQGWRHSPGLYRWDEEKGKAVALTREEREQYREQERGHDIGGRAQRMEVHGDAESLESYCKGEPAKDLDLVMQREDADWQQVHAVLMRHTAQDLQVHLRRE